MNVVLPCLLCFFAGGGFCASRFLRESTHMVSRFLREVLSCLREVSLVLREFSLFPRSCNCCSLSLSVPVKTQHSYSLHILR